MPHPIKGSIMMDRLQGEDGKPRIRSGARALCYAASLTNLQWVARKCGYSLAVHGSMARDLDLVAVPWVSTAKSAEELVEALRAAVDGVLKETDIHFWGHKPHGRRAFAIHLNSDEYSLTPYLDISVMPRECDWETAAGEFARAGVELPEARKDVKDADEAP